MTCATSLMLVLLLGHSHGAWVMVAHRPDTLAACTHILSTRLHHLGRAATCRGRLLFEKCTMARHVGRALFCVVISSAVMRLLLVVRIASLQFMAHMVVLLCSHVATLIILRTVLAVHVHGTRAALLFGEILLAELTLLLRKMLIWAACMIHLRRGFTTLVSHFWWGTNARNRATRSIYTWILLESTLMSSDSRRTRLSRHTTGCWSSDSFRTSRKMVM